MKAERFSLAQFNEQFPDDAACLDYIWAQRFPNGLTCPTCEKHGRFHRVSTRKTYSCECGYQVSPCEGTIFHKSSTKLTTWFLAMFYMTASKNGVSAKELERLTGVTYKTAWRMGHQIRQLMNQGTELLTGTVEADETYVGGKAANMHASKRALKITGRGGEGGNKTIVIGVLERGGKVRAHVAPAVTRAVATSHTVATVAKGSRIFTDEHSAYDFLVASGYGHERIAHGKGEYVRDDIHTNTVEGFWGQLKRSIKGTFHQVSREHLQAYVNEFAFRYNHRASVTEAPIFPALISRVAEKHS